MRPTVFAMSLVLLCSLILDKAHAYSCQLVGETAADEIDAYLSQLFDDGKLNGNVLVTRHGKTLYEKSFGYADGSKTLLLDKNYRFNIGSVYKEFPAVATMQLVEKQRISLDDRISKYLTDLPDWGDQVSIKNLLQYSSGLPKIGWDEYFRNGIDIADQNLKDEIQSIKALEFKPGSDYLYSNSNPILLIRMIEEVTQAKFSDYLREHIFKTCGMNGTVFKDRYPYADKSLMAVPFDTEFKEDAYEVSVRSQLLSSTARDMQIWLEQLGDFSVVSSESVKKLSEVAKAGDNIQSPLGRCEWEAGKITEHSHHGSTANYECVVRRFKQEGVTVVVLTNQKHRNVYDISNEIYRMVKKDN